MAQQNKLIIVESPAKARTITKFLGRGYKVEASQGHIRDLPKSQIGVDVDNNFEPKYITIRGRGEILTRIRKEAKAAKAVYLATDPDREGEAISWHLANILGIDPSTPCRVKFHEITEKEIKSAIKSRNRWICTWWTRSRRAACSTGWSVIKSVPSCGAKSARGFPPGAYNRSPRR